MHPLDSWFSVQIVDDKIKLPLEIVNNSEC